MTMTRRTPRTLVAATAASLMAGVAVLSGAAHAQDGGELNLYSSRHYDTDERLYSDFEQMTGITINRIEAGADELITRMEAEGSNSPADVLLTVDAGRLWRADQAGLLAPVESDVLERRIPDHLSHPEGHWHGFSQRSRIIFYDKEDVENPPQTYMDLADPQYEGLVCTRSSSNIYMISLMAAMIEHHGEEQAAEWAQGMYDNRAREPEGNDTAQLRALASGECDIAVANTYYFARAIAGDVEGLSEEERQNIGWVFPNQDSTGAHMNISGGALAANAPNQENAVRFLEYLSSEQAQEYFSAGNNEYPAVPGVALAEPVAELGLFRQDDLNLSKLGENQQLAQKVYDQVGYP